MKETAFDEKFSLGGHTIRANAIFDGDDAVFVFAKGRINEAMVLGNMAVDDGEVFFLDEAIFEGFAKFTSGSGIFSDQDDAASFTVEAVDKIGSGCWGLASGVWSLGSRFLGLGTGGQIEASTTDEARHFAILGGMTDEACGFVDDKQIGILENNIEHTAF